MNQGVRRGVGRPASTPYSAKTFQDQYGVHYNALAYGILANGQADDTGAWNRLFAIVQQAGGGTIFLPPGRTSLCLGTLTPIPFVNSTAASAPLRITGSGSGVPQDTGFVPASGSTLDLRSTSGNAKIDCRGYGTLEIDHLNLVSGGTDDASFVFSSNTMLNIHDCYFYGHSGNSGTSCVQDAIVLGGATLGSLQTGNSDAPFQGYGTVIERNGFSHIRSGVLFKDAANAVQVSANTFANTCGGDSTHGAFTHTAPTLHSTGNLFVGNTVECGNYTYVWYFGSKADHNYGFGNGMYDPTNGSATFVATYKDATGITPSGIQFHSTYTAGTGDHPDVASQVTLSSGSSYTPTASGRYLVACVGGGGSGASGGTPSNTTAQAGSGGGSQGASAMAWMDLVSGTAYTTTFGSGGTGPSTTTAGGHPGTIGGSGGATSFAGPSFTLTAVGGPGGNPSAATSTTAVGGGQAPAFSNVVTTSGLALDNHTGLSAPDGWGGGSATYGTATCTGGGPLGFGAGGGGGGGAANGTNGGTGGNAGAYGVATGGTVHGSASANGGDGQNATSTNYGAGGGGGGAGAAGTGTGGKGGNGAPGAIFLFGPFPTG